MECRFAQNPDGTIHCPVCGWTSRHPLPTTARRQCRPRVAHQPPARKITAAAPLLARHPAGQAAARVRAEVLEFLAKTFLPEQIGGRLCLASRRLAICATCDRFDAPTASCADSGGCCAARRAWLIDTTRSSATCPAGRWPE